MKLFETAAEYNKAMSDIRQLMNKGESSLSEKKLKNCAPSLWQSKLKKKSIYIAAPSTFEGMIELRM